MDHGAPLGCGDMATFPPQTKEQWLNKVARAAKGVAFDADAVLFHRQSSQAVNRPWHGPWTIFARVDHADRARASQQATEDIANGVAGLVLTPGAEADALEHLPLHKLALRNEAGDAGAASLQHLINRLPLDPGRLVIDFGAGDTLLAKTITAQGFVSPLMRGDGRDFHDRGCSDAEELGAALAQAIAALRKLDFLNDARLPGSVSLTLAAAQNMFSTLAKFRAARILWRDILSICKLPDAPLRLHGETSRAMMADVDAHTNILRTVTAVFGAGLGGADSICVQPFSAAQGLPNAFARRVARNVQNLLLHEAHLWRVQDPAAGAGALEHLTERYCDQAWRVLQACERGDWPRGGASSVAPKIGVTVARPSAELPADVEAM
jgi:methylmalonyl-CoA mutase